MLPLWTLSVVAIVCIVPARQLVSCYTIYSHLSIMVQQAVGQAAGQVVGLAVGLGAGLAVQG
jgi:hypothetical protein